MTEPADPEAPPADRAGYVPDLMDRSRLGACGIRFVSSVADLVAAAASDQVTTVVVDLQRPGVLDALPALAAQARVVGFAAHVDTETLDAATAAGCALALPRSRFFARLPEVLE
jgi:DNA-binding NarL/FixJ family response regulator